MDPEQPHATFTDWAVLEIMGHQKYAGYVTTQPFGDVVLFRIDVPELGERERITDRPGYVGGQYVPAGTIVKEGTMPGFTKLFGAKAIFSVTPCTEEVALKLVESYQTRPLMSVTVPPGLAIPAGTIMPDFESDRRTGYTGYEDEDA